MDPSSRSSPPVALRIVRPYRTEDDLLAAEANAFTRTGVVLIGAPSRPSGVVLRFELALVDGTPVMRGEGRVVGYRAPTSAEEGALMLRFTRLDVKSKDLLDRAVALREERRSLAPPPKPPTVDAPAPVEPAPAPPPSRTPPASSQPPQTDREAMIPPLAEAALDAPHEPAPAPTDEPSSDAALEVDDLDLASADENDLTAQAPPVALHDDAEASGAGPKAPEKVPPPTPSPGRVPIPHPEPPPQPTPPRHAPEHAPVPRLPPEHAPMPSPSPTKPRRAGAREAFRPTLEPAQRDSALERLRARQRAKQA